MITSEWLAHSIKWLLRNWLTLREIIEMSHSREKIWIGKFGQEHNRVFYFIFILKTVNKIWIWIYIYANMINVCMLYIYLIFITLILFHTCQHHWVSICYTFEYICVYAINFSVKSLIWWNADKTSDIYLKIVDVELRELLMRFNVLMHKCISKSKHSKIQNSWLSSIKNKVVDLFLRF